MKLVAVLVALVTLASGGFQGLPRRFAPPSSRPACESPVAFVADPADPSIFYAVEQGGRIRVVRNRVVAEDFLDLRGATVGGGERGLLGMALAPDFPTSGRFFVNFTNTNGDTVVARFSDRSGTVDPASRFDLKWGPERSPVILQPFVEPQRRPSRVRPRWLSLHRAGRRRQRRRSAATAPRTRRRCSARCCGSTSNVPDDHPNGYVVPADNPFLGGTPVAARPEIWSFGWRNPWRYSFDRSALGGTGALVIGDVGQNAGRRSTTSRAGAAAATTAGAIREGAQLNPNLPRRRLPPAYQPLIDPIHEYSHSQGTVGHAAVSSIAALARRRLSWPIFLSPTTSAAACGRSGLTLGPAARRPLPDYRAHRGARRRRSSATSAPSASTSRASSTSSATAAASSCGCSAT